MCANHVHLIQTADNLICYMNGENPVSSLTQFVFINLYVYMKTGLNWPTGGQCMETSSKYFPEDDVVDTFLIFPPRELKYYDEYEISMSFMKST